MVVGINSEWTKPKNKQTKQIKKKVKNKENKENFPLKAAFYQYCISIEIMGCILAHKELVLTEMYPHIIIHGAFFLLCVGFLISSFWFLVIVIFGSKDQKSILFAHHHQQKAETALVNIVELLELKGTISKL